MIKGYVVNNLGRGKHIFKRSFYPGMEVPLEEIYNLYSNSYEGDFDTGFLEWLEKNKIPNGCGFDIVVEEIKESDEKVITKVKNALETPAVPTAEVSLPVPNKMTARQLADLKMKNKPKQIIQQVMSVHKLRRALSLCKGRPGKETLIKYIRERLTELS
jgi:hypothetical protein